MSLVDEAFNEGLEAAATLALDIDCDMESDKISANLVAAEIRALKRVVAVTLAGQPKIDKPIEPDVRLSFAQIGFLKRLTHNRRNDLENAQFGWALLPMLDEVIGQLGAALDAEKARRAKEMGT